MRPPRSEVGTVGPEGGGRGRILSGGGPAAPRTGKSLPCLRLLPALFLLSLPLTADSADHGAGARSAAALALELHDAGQHAAAAVEYRRLALAEPDAGRGAGYRWAAAYEYLLAGKHELALRMLDRAEDGSRGFAAQMLLLRAEAAMAGGAPDEAAFHLESMLAGLPADKSSAALRAVATRRLGRARMAARDAGGARQALRDVPDAAARDAALAAIAGYERGRDRRPWLGGVLGVIPGLGHAYSGEYANAVRSLLLNGLFIYGMAHTARNDQWGAFAAIGFFELTWYTGSIYGGVDAAHRYNRERLDDCVRQVGGGAAFEPDLGRIPIVSIRVDL